VSPSCPFWSIGLSKFGEMAEKQLPCPWASDVTPRHQMSTRENLGYPKALISLETKIVERLQERKPPFRPNPFRL
jgi:hypothetical protein